MSTILIYCNEIKLGKELKMGMRKLNAQCEFCQSPASLSERVMEGRPDILVVCLGRGENCSILDFASMKNSSPDTKIIYAPRSPGKEDVKCLEHGVFYYAGDAGSQEILKAVKAALKRKQN